jgi:TATA-box binding protein (TBP) (component of TFIID and TFIIIB)
MFFVLFCKTKKQKTCNFNLLIKVSDNAASLESALVSYADQLTPLKKRPHPGESDLPIIVNLVCTASFLPEKSKYKLPLNAITTRLACSQYAPVVFAANIIKVKDSISDCTALVFSTGKIVVVSGLTVAHALYACQLIRTIIEQVMCTVYLEEEQRVKQDTLCGRLLFNNFHVYNIVGHGFLGCKIDLQKLADFAPTSCKYRPTVFPGLKCKIWLNSANMCICKKEEEEDELKDLPSILKRGKCICSIKALVFKSGKIVLIGGRTISDVNSVYFRMRDHLPAINSMEEFYKRFSELLVTTTDAATATADKIKTKKELSAKEAILNALFVDEEEEEEDEEEQQISKKIATSALVQFAISGRIDDVKTTLIMDPDAKNDVPKAISALENVKVKNEAQQQVLTFLMSFT